jgi:hypothetical protein
MIFIFANESFFFFFFFLLCHHIYCKHAKGRFTLWPKVERSSIPPMRLQETNSLASQPFTLRPKSKSHRNLK